MMLCFKYLEVRPVESAPFASWLLAQKGCCDLVGENAAAAAAGKMAAFQRELKTRTCALAHTQLSNRDTVRIISDAVSK